MQTLGPISNLETEMQALMIESGVQVTKFSKAAISCLPKHAADSPWMIPSVEFEYRRDLRESHLIYSIDPPGCEVSVHDLHVV